ncbi:poly(A) RNA polymerase gld-2 homolog A [Nephila pilipes]|uniref:Poly(A) RNA polymerase gld-2 homolog A n=1 Tax=Nephila pilipes TaxID=299642 RepID=A0A8X6Q993_NEPPI|nr:poly(A) RNA polymerase gld-2 homolog A [Nephila pilipes]
MDQSISGYKRSTERRQTDNAPVFYTGLTNAVFNIECLTSLLCKHCKKNIKNLEPNSDDLCNNCIAETKKHEVIKQNDQATTTSNYERFKQNDQATTTSNYERFSPNTKRTLLPAPSSPCNTNNLLNNSSESHIQVNEISDQDKRNSVTPLNHDSGGKWKSGLQQRLNSRRRASPYSQDHRKNQDRNKNLYGSPFMTTPVAENGKSGQKRSIQGNNVLHFSSPPLSNWSSPVHNSTEQLSMEIWELFHQNKQTEDVFSRKMALRDKLHNILRARFPNCGLYVVGSSMTGLGVKSSDIDMCLMLTDSEVDQQKEAVNILHSIKYLFLKYKFLYNIQVIHAKVPILKFIDIESGIEVDLNINNTIGIRNTQLLSSYARIDKRLPPLVVLAKIWARHHGINDAKHNSLSSYSIVLMVIHYLQYRSQPPVLPCLQKLQSDKFLPNTDIRKLKLREDLPDFISENYEDLGDLFIGFLKYYSEEFNYLGDAISVRIGCVIPRGDAVHNSSPKNKLAHWKHLCIEEPFDLTNTARAVFNAEVFEHILYVFRTSCNQITEVSSLDSILS